MAKKTDEGQQRLKVITTIDENPTKQTVDPSGQVLLFQTQKVLVPPELEGFANFMNNRLYRTEKALEESAAQSKRLANSLETVIPKFIDQSVNNTRPDLVFAHLKEGQEADVAIADGMTVASEAVYILSAGEVAERIGNDYMSPTRMGMIIRDFGLFGDPKFHHTFSTSKHGSCQKYKPTIIEEIYRRLSNPSEHNLDHEKVARAANFIRPKGAIGS